MYLKMNNHNLNIEDLEKQYPLCFKHQGCCMLGIECQTGWNQLLHNLFTKLEGYLAANPEKFIDCEFPFRIDQIKEKFGTLRFYVSGAASDEMMIAIDDAEVQSAKICEVCSKRGVVHVSKGGFWLKTLCSECAKDEYIPYNRNMMP
jgi:hypothetical protein